MLNKILASVFCIVVAIVVALFLKTQAPILRHGTYISTGSTQQTVQMPFWRKSDSSKFILNFELVVPLLSYRTFEVLPDDCIEKMIINNHIVQDPLLPFCDTKGRILDLSDYLHNGINHFEVHMRDIGVWARFNMHVAYSDPIWIIAHIIVLFFFLSGIAIILHDYLTVSDQKTKIIYCYLLLLIIAITGLAVRLWLSPHPGFGSDMWMNKGWMKSAVDLGPAKSYLQQTSGAPLPNYPPFSIIIFWLAGLVQYLFYGIINTDSQITTVFVKTPAIIADVTTIIVSFYLVRHFASEKLALLASCILALHPATIYNSAIWGQTDSIFTLFSLLTIASVTLGHFFTAGILAAIALLIKPQAIIFAPLLLFLFLKIHQKIIPFLKGLILATSFILLPFMCGGALDRIREVYLGYVGHYPKLSVAAYNLWWALFGKASEQSDSIIVFATLSYRTIGLLFFIIAYAVILMAMGYHLLNTKKHLYKLPVALLCASSVSVAFFTLNTEMHERYLFPLMVFGLLAAMHYQATIWLYITASTTYLFNLLGVMPYGFVDSFVFSTFPAIREFIATLNVVICIAYIVITIRIMLFNKP